MSSSDGPAEQKSYVRVTWPAIRTFIAEIDAELRWICTSHKRATTRLTARGYKQRPLRCNSSNYIDSKNIYILSKTSPLKIDAGWVESKTDLT